MLLEMKFKSIKRMMKDDELTYEDAVDRYAEQIDYVKDFLDDKEMEKSMRKK